MTNLKSDKKFKIFIVILVIILIIMGIYFIAPKSKNLNKKGDIHIDDAGNVEIIVVPNEGGMQESISGVQSGATNPNLGAASVQEITGGENPVNQPQSIDDVLKDKEIEIQK